MNYLDYPKTVDEAVKRLIKALRLKDRAYIANLEKKDIHLVSITLGSFIRDECGIGVGNRALIESCRTLSGNDELKAYQAFIFLIEALWKELRDTHSLRRVI